MGQFSTYVQSDPRGVIHSFYAIDLEMDFPSKLEQMFRETEGFELIYPNLFEAD